MVEWKSVYSINFPFLEESFSSTLNVWCVNAEFINPLLTKTEIICSWRDLSKENSCCEHENDSFSEFISTISTYHSEETLSKIPKYIKEYLELSKVDLGESIIVQRLLQPKWKEKDPILIQWVIWNGKHEMIFFPEHQNSDLPFYHPEVEGYKIHLLSENKNEETQNLQLHFSVLINKNQTNDLSQTTKLYQIAERQCSKLLNWSKRSETGYKAKLKCDQLVEYSKFSIIYSKLKSKYGYIVDEWEETTDPKKFVFEDIAIASYLLCLWENEREKQNLEKKQEFVDVGCGNGLLTFILTNEGHKGFGIDLKKRKIWDKFISTNLIESDVLSKSYNHSGGGLSSIPSLNAFNDEFFCLCKNLDWVIANHSDELTPYSPLLAALISSKAKFFAIPCCMFTFGGRKFQTSDLSQGRYLAYVNHIDQIAKSCGFETKWDRLRIPSVKCIAIVGFEQNENENYLKLSNKQIESNNNNNNNNNGEHLRERDKQNQQKMTKISLSNSDDIAIEIFKSIIKINFNNNNSICSVKYNGITVEINGNEGEITLLNSEPIVNIKELFDELQKNDKIKVLLRSLSGGFKSFLRIFDQIFVVLEFPHSRTRVPDVKIKDWSKSVSYSELKMDKKCKFIDSLRSKCCFYDKYGVCPKAEECSFAHKSV